METIACVGFDSRIGRMSDVPDRYRPDAVLDKDKLYKYYWGEMMSSSEIAEELSVPPSRVRRTLVEHGIPRRTGAFAQNNSVSPFRGFYNGDEAARTDSDSTQRYDDEYERPASETIDWRDHWVGETDD